MTDEPQEPGAETPEKHAGGRPSIFTQKIADQVCAMLADGKSLRTVCRGESMPCASTVFKWLREMPEFSQQYARAKHECADMYAEDVVDISDDSSRDFIETDKGPVFNAEHVQRARLRVDTRKWVASKLKPKKYGDRIEHTGPDGGPVQISIVRYGDDKAS